MGGKASNPTLTSDCTYNELERLSALETLKGLKQPEKVKLSELVDFLQERGLWSQFAKITLGDLRQAFTPPEEKPARKRKRRILQEELAGTEASDEAKPTAKPEPDDGGMSTDEVARIVLPFVEGNGDVALDDIAEYSRLDRKVLRHHLGALVKDGRLERIGVGRHAIYSTIG
ncbi:MAG: hypothetical protein B7733_03675 [Myxococcales bacterium FL481]|nr:MAG: hypothetical protein B7733_03675 [Myxococcales bacterium FL481]